MHFLSIYWFNKIDLPDEVIRQITLITWWDHLIITDKWYPPSGPSSSLDGPVYVEGDSSARDRTPDEGGYSTRIEAGPSKGFDHEEDDYQNNPPFYDNI